jgi:membrane fusion protein, multidrug efflux system
MGDARGNLCWLIVLSLAVVGCEQQKSSEPPLKVTTKVVVRQPIVDEVRDYEEFTGHTDAILSVEIMSRVTGYLMKKNFLDGDETHEGDILYEIDDRPYRAALVGAESTLLQAEAHLKRVEADFKRASNLFLGANIHKEEFDLSSSNYAEAKALLGVAKASLDTARLNMEYTKIRSPMTGQLSRTLIDPGNLIRQDTTILNDIVQADKLYVYFDLNEEGMQRVSELIRLGRVDSKNGEQFEVEVGTSVDLDRHDDALGRLRDLTVQLKKQGKKPTAEDERVPDEFPYKGLVNFSENTLDAATGTLRIRGIIDNPAPYILSPGLFVRVRLPIGKPHREVLVRNEAIGSDQGRNFVYVIDAGDEVVYRPVVAGPIFKKGRSIREGLKSDERIMVDPEEIRRVRPGAKVEATVVADDE